MDLHRLPPLPFLSDNLLTQTVLSLIFSRSNQSITKQVERVRLVEIAGKTHEGSYVSRIDVDALKLHLTDDLRADIFLFFFFFSFSFAASYPLKDRPIMRLNDRPESTLTRTQAPHEPDEKWIRDSRRACTPPFSIAEEKPARGESIFAELTSVSLQSWTRLHLWLFFPSAFHVCTRHLYSVSIFLSLTPHKYFYFIC